MYKYTHIYIYIYIHIYIYIFKQLTEFWRNCADKVIEIQIDFNQLF